MKKLFKAIILMTVLAVTLTGCSEMKMWLKGGQENFVGLTATLRSFDANGEMIDRVDGTSISLARETKFDTEKKDSSVIRATVGDNEMYHVGSALVMSENGLDDILDTVDTKIVIDDSDRAVPFINTLLTGYRNSFTPRSKVLMIRSQQGHPLAVYTGDRVSIHASDLPNATRFLIDGKLLLVYRVDYTLYDTDLLN